MSDKNYDVTIINDYKPTFEPSEKISFFHLDQVDLNKKYFDQYYGRS